ncbi:acetyltransferase, fucose-4-O-acetylase [Lachnospiraceae bacterium JC7]|nr:acetyltransferase, fucose-4-O-acetylase [Lachnospiraceae bacterium JC7]
MSDKKKVRIELIDIAKAITIILVILGHTTGNLDTPMYRRLLYSFHMPLFFFLAGMSIKAKELRSFREWISFIKKNLLALIVPYLIFAFIYAPFNFENVPKFLYGSWQMLGKTGTLTSLWYLTCFFVARIYCQVLMNILSITKCKNMNLWLGILAVPMFAIGFLFPKIEIGYPWCMNVSFIASGFILLGIALRQQILILAQSKTLMLFLITLISGIMLTFGTILRGDALELSLMCGGDYGNIFWFMYNSISGTVLILGISMLIFRISREGARPFSTKAITYVGQHTLGIFLLHKNIQLDLIIPWIHTWLEGPQLLVACIATCLSFAAALILCAVIETFVPQLLGQFPRYPDKAN